MSACVRACVRVCAGPVVYNIPTVYLAHHIQVQGLELALRLWSKGSSLCTMEILVRLAELSTLCPRNVVL